MGTKPISDEKYAEIIESIHTISTESVYPCSVCVRKSCPGAKCEEWLPWFFEAWPIVTNVFKQAEGDTE